MVSLRLGGDASFARFEAEAAALSAAQRARVRLVLSQPRPEWTPARLAESFVITAWGLGSEAARLLPFESLLHAATRPPRRAPALRAALEAVAPGMGPTATASILLDADGAPGLAAVGLAAATAGWRVAAARLAEPGRLPGGILELVPPDGRLGGGPRTRANRSLAPAPGGAGDPPCRGVGGPLRGARRDRRALLGQRAQPRRNRGRRGCSPGPGRARRPAAPRRRAPRGPGPERPAPALCRRCRQAGGRRRWGPCGRRRRRPRRQRRCRPCRRRAAADADGPGQPARARRSRARAPRPAVDRPVGGRPLLAPRSARRGRGGSPPGRSAGMGSLQPARDGCLGARGRGPGAPRGAVSWRGHSRPVARGRVPCELRSPGARRRPAGRSR